MNFFKQWASDLQTHDMLVVVVLSMAIIWGVYLTLNPWQVSPQEAQACMYVACGVSPIEGPLLIVASILYMFLVIPRGYREAPL